MRGEGLLNLRGELIAVRETLPDAENVGDSGQVITLALENLDFLEPVNVPLAVIGIPADASRRCEQPPRLISADIPRGHADPAAELVHCEPVIPDLSGARRGGTRHRLDGSHESF